MRQKKILVTGANGQLGKSLQAVQPIFSDNCHFVFTDVDTLDITDKQTLMTKVHNLKADFIINAAAYTAVDKAESDVEKAYLLNETAVRNLAEVAESEGAFLVHVSTDYVFDGHSTLPYSPDSQTNPISVYGKSKLAGEQAILQTNCRAAIIRTQWLYSQFGNNFVKTMLRLADSKPEIRVVNDQVGCPTLALDLALFIMEVVNNDYIVKGQEIYHFADQGQISWYDFAVEILRLAHKNCPVIPISTQEYPTAATRPNFSVFDLSKAINDFNYMIPEWNESLEKTIHKIIHNYEHNIL